MRSGYKQYDRWPKDLAGLRFGRLECIELERYTPRGMALWKCRCDCGNEPIIQRYSLLNGRTKSCGCLKMGRPKTHSK